MGNKLPFKEKMDRKGENSFGGFPCILLILCFSVFIQKAISAQAPQSQAFKFSGGLNLTSEFYKINGIEARQPGSTQRAVMRSIITLYDQVELPFEFYWTNSEAKFQQPFSQFGINPQLTSWLKLHGGYFSARVSELSFGDVRLLGGGIELTPGDFRLKILYGKSRKAVESDTSQNFQGAFSQMTYAASLGYGNENKAFFNINLFHAIDDTNSIKRNRITQAANENLVASLNFGFRPFEALYFDAEAAVSAFSNDITSAKTAEKLKSPSFLFTPRLSSQADGAAKVFISIIPDKTWSVKLGGKWVGPGFVSLGYAQMPGDYLEVTAAPAVSLLNNHLNMRASLGVRSNNLRSTKLSTTNRFTGLFSGDYQIDQSLGFNVQFSNNQIRSSHKNDTVKISNVLNYFLLSPRYAFMGFGGNNNINLSYSFQNSLDTNPFISAITQNQTNTINLIHSLFLPSTLSLTSSLMYNSINLTLVKTQMININETFGYQFFDGRLYTSVSLGYSMIKVTSQNNMILLRLSSSYSLDKLGSVSLNISNNHFNSAEEYNPGYSELQANLQYDINF